MLGRRRRTHRIRARISAIDPLTMYATSEEYEVSGLYHEIYPAGNQGPDEDRRTICRLPVQAPEDAGETRVGF